MTRRELIRRLTAAADPVYDAGEAAAIARLVAEKRYDLTRADLALDPLAAVDPGPEFDRLMADLAAARPVQYILGVADFDGLELAVGEGVLIPRPETEELVRRIAADLNAADVSAAGENATDPGCFSSKAGIRILDVGTGSGAIAIALAKRLPGARVTAIDISSEALRYARLNNGRTRTGVEIDRADLFDPAFDPGPCDVIVSNPPYIPTSERSAMADNVTRHEPPEALFVPDDDPLLFYRAIARLACRRLSPEGTLWFEIHSTTACEIKELLVIEGFREIEVYDDINSKPRMVRCRP
jgi:release factor glutamine methyltransferase